MGRLGWAPSAGRRAPKCSAAFFVQAIVDGNVPTAKASKVVGHEDIRTTQAHYYALSAGRRRIIGRGFRFDLQHVVPDAMEKAEEDRRNHAERLIWTHQFHCRRYCSNRLIPAPRLHVPEYPHLPPILTGCAGYGRSVPDTPHALKSCANYRDYKHWTFNIKF